MIYKQPIKIYLGDNTIIHAYGEGNVNLPSSNPLNASNVMLNLHKVLHVPKLTKNLLSVPAMASMGAEIRFDKEKCVVV